MREPFLRSHPLIVSTLSPVHVGCGEDYQPTEYVMDDGVFYQFNPVEALADNKSAREELAKICNGQGDTVLRDVQKFFFKRKDELISFSTQRLPVGEEMQKFYDQRVGKTTEIGKNTIHKLDIERTSHVLGADRPILPGSSLKGSIRTALLDHVHGGKPLADKRDAENKKNKWKELNPLSVTLRLCVPQKFELDPMRLIRIADMNVVAQHWFGNDIRFALNFKISGGEGKGPYQTLECLPPLLLESLGGDLAILDPAQARHADGEGKKLPHRDVTWGFKEVVARCNRYYCAHFRRELESEKFEPYLHKTWRKIMLDSLHGGGLKRLLASGRAFLLRVGRHSGAESVTLNGARWIQQGKKWDKQPSTVWLAGLKNKQEESLLPFGWLLLELNDEQRRPLHETVPELARLAAGVLERKKKLLEKSDAKLASLSEKTEEKRLQEAKLQEEKERLEAQEKQQQMCLASLSENLKLVETFRGEIASAPLVQPVGGVLWNTMQTLLREVENKREKWLTEEVLQLEKVCLEELPKKLKGAEKKLKEVKQRLIMLKGGEA